MKTAGAVQSFLASRLAISCRPRTIKWYSQLFDRFIASFPDELPLEPEPIEHFLANVVAPEHDYARHAYYRALKALYRFICQRSRLGNPFNFIVSRNPRKKIPATLSSEEMLRILNQAQHCPRDKAIISLLIDSVARVGEITSLCRQNIHEDYIQVEGKTGERNIPISEETRRILLFIVASNKGTSDRVFQGKKGPLTRWTISDIVHKYMIRAGITGPKLGPHRVRHAFGKNYIKNGGDTRSLQKIMGHSNISTTEIYVELAQDEIIAKHHQFTPLRSVQSAAQIGFDVDSAIKEAEAIIAKTGEDSHED